MNKEIEFSKCEKSSSVYSETGEWGYYLKCSDCNKPIKDSFEYYNHYDGEDHCTGG
jgi:hypothetical protein